VLMDVLKNDKENSVRAAAVQTLGQYGFQRPKEVLPLVIEALKDKSPQLRLSAAQALQQMGHNGKKALPELTEALKDSESNVRQHAFYALCNMVPDSLPAMVGYLSAGDSHAREITLSYCVSQNHRKKEMVPALIECLKDKNFNVRIQACKLLGQLGKEATDAVEALRALVNDSNPNVQTAAQTALNAIQPKK
jgi:HEAT repeat protein